MWFLIISSRLFCSKSQFVILGDRYLLPCPEIGICTYWEYIWVSQLLILEFTKKIAIIFLKEFNFHEIILIWNCELVKKWIGKSRILREFTVILHLFMILHVLFWKKTLKFPRVIAQISHFEWAPVYLYRSHIWPAESI